MSFSLLLVESDRDIAAALVDLLEEEGHCVVQTGSGLTALELAAGRHFDLVILDMQLEELPGDAVLRVMGDLAIRIPLIVMSLHRHGWQRDAFLNGASACLSKPFGRRALLSLIECYGGTLGSPSPWPADVRALSPEELETLSRLSPQALDALPFGAIRIDARGRIDRYNRVEADASTFFPPSVIGLRFQDIAPCTSVKEFAGAIQDAFTHGELDRELSFIFPHLGARSLVTVRLYLDRLEGRVWIFVSKRRAEVPAHLRGDSSLNSTIEAIP